MRISVCVPVYNMERTLEKTLRSALTQDDEDFEVLVVDNQSTDRTWEIASRLADPRLRVVRNERNLGPYGNHNRCLALATGEWVKFLHGDDELFPGCLARFRRAVAQAPEATALIACGGVLGAEDGKECGRTFLPPEGAVFSPLPARLFVLAGNIIGTPTMTMIHREKMQSVGGFDLSMEPAADGDAWITLMESFHTVILPDHLVLLRDDPPSSPEKRRRQSFVLWTRIVAQVDKWCGRDEVEFSRPFARSVYGKWLVRESCRLWDVALANVLQGHTELFRAMAIALLHRGVFWISLFHYGKHRVYKKLRRGFFPPWSESLSQRFDVLSQSYGRPKT